MPLFRKKPVVIEAIQFTKEVALEALIKRLPGPFGIGVNGNFHPEKRELYSACGTITTLEGVMRADIDDWIIKGVKGEVYPCKPDIFTSTYEPALQPFHGQPIEAFCYKPPVPPVKEPPFPNSPKLDCVGGDGCKVTVPTINP